MINLSSDVNATDNQTTPTFLDIMQQTALNISQSDSNYKTQKKYKNLTEGAYVDGNCSNLTICPEDSPICATYTQQCAGWTKVEVADYYNLNSDFSFDQLHQYQKALAAFTARMLVKYNVNQAQITKVIMPVGVNQAAVDRIVHTVTGDKASAIFDQIQNPNAKVWAQNLFYTWVEYWTPAIQDYYLVVQNDMPEYDYSKSFLDEVKSFIPNLLVAQSARELIYGIDYLLILNKCVSGQYPPSYLNDKYLVPSLSALDLSQLVNVNSSVVHYAVQGIVQDTLQLAYYNLDTNSQAFFDSIPDEVYQELTNFVTNYNHRDIWSIDAQTTIASDLVYFTVYNQSNNITDSILPDEIQQTFTQVYNNWTGYDDQRYYNLSLPQTKDSLNSLEKDINRFIVRMFKKYNVTQRNIAALKKVDSFDFYFADITQKLVGMRPKQIYNLIDDQNTRIWVKNIVKTWGKRWSSFLGDLLQILNSNKSYYNNFDYNKTFSDELVDFIPQLLFKNIKAQQDRFLIDQTELTCAKFLSFVRKINELNGVETGLIDPSLLYFTDFVAGISFENFTSKGQLDSETAHYIIQSLLIDTLNVIDITNISQQSLDFLNSIPDEVYIALYNFIQQQQDTSFLYDMYLKISQKEERMYIANYIKSNNSDSTANTEPEYNYLYENLIYDKTCTILNLSYFQDSQMTNMTQSRDLTNNYTQDTWEKYEKDVANFLTLAIYRYNISELDPYNVTNQDLINVIQNSKECANDSYQNIVQLLLNNTNSSYLFDSIPSIVQIWLKNYSIQFAQKWGPSILKRLMNDTYADYTQADDSGNYNVLYDSYDFIPLFLANQQMTPFDFRYLKEGMLDFQQIIQGNSNFDKLYEYSANFSSWNISSPDEINSTVMAYTIKDFVLNRTGLYYSQLSNESIDILESIPEELWLSLENLFNYLISTQDYYYPIPADQFIEDQITLYMLSQLDGYVLPLYQYMATYDNETSVEPDNYVEVNASYYDLDNQEIYDDFSWYVKDIIEFVARIFIKYDVEGVDQAYQLFEGNFTSIWGNLDENVQLFINETAAGLLEDWGDAIVDLSMSSLNFTGLLVDQSVSQDFRTFVPLLLLSHNVTPSAWFTLLSQLEQIDQVMVGSATPNKLGDMVPQLHIVLGDNLILNNPLLSYSIFAVIRENLNIKNLTYNSIDWLVTLPESGVLQFKDFLLNLNDTYEGNGYSIAQNIYSAMDYYYQNNDSFSDYVGLPLYQYFNNNSVDYDQSYRGNSSFYNQNYSNGSNILLDNSSISSLENEDTNVMEDIAYWDLSNNLYYDKMHLWFKDLAKFMTLQFYKYGVNVQNLQAVQLCNITDICDLSYITQALMNGASSKFYLDMPQQLQTFIYQFTVGNIAIWGNSIQAALAQEDFSEYDTQTNETDNILNDFQNFVPSYFLRHMVGSTSFKDLSTAMTSITNITNGQFTQEKLNQIALFEKVSQNVSLADFNNASFVSKLVKDSIIQTLQLNNISNESRYILDQSIPDYVYLSIIDLFETLSKTTVGDDNVDLLTSIYNEMVRETLSYMDGYDLPLDKYMLTNADDYRADVNTNRVYVDESYYNLSNNDSAYDSLFEYQKDLVQFMARMFVKYNLTIGESSLNKDFNVSQWDVLDITSLGFQQSLSNFINQQWNKLWKESITDVASNMTQFEGNPNDTRIWDDLRTFIPLLLEKHNVTPSQLEVLYSQLYAIADLASETPSNSSIQTIQEMNPDLYLWGLQITPDYLNDDLTGYLVRQAFGYSFKINNLTQNSQDWLSSFDWTVFTGFRDIFFALDQVIEPNGDSLIKNIYADLVIYENLTTNMNITQSFYDAYMSDSLTYFGTKSDIAQNQYKVNDSNSTDEVNIIVSNDTDVANYTNFSSQINDSLTQDYQYDDISPYYYMPTIQFDEDNSDETTFLN